MSRSFVLVVEDAVHRTVTRALRRLGRPVRVQVFPGFGTDGWARVGGRVLLDVRPPAAPRTRTPTRWAVRANLAQFLTFELPHARVEVEVGGQRAVVVADRDGYVDATLPDVHLPPGRHPAALTPVEPAGPPAHGTVHVPHPAADLAVVSDIDDTIVDSGIAAGVLATLTTALLRDATTRVPLDGAPELYRALARDPGGGPARPFFYLSTSPWNLVGFLTGFLTRHGFPEGPLLLTDWGPGRSSLFRVGTRTHKLTALRELASVLPGRLVLIGDSGQQDPEIYAAFVVEHPGRTAAVYIRRAGALDEPAQARLAECARTLADTGVPFVVADDSAAMLRHARDHGLAGWTG